MKNIAVDHYKYVCYKVESPSSKFYIGVTGRGFGHRRLQHENLARRGGKYAIHKAIRKYGDKLKWEVVGSSDSFEIILDLEVLLIENYNAFTKGYNLTLGGEGVLGWCPTEEVRKKMSLAAMGHKNLVGHKRSEYTKRKISDNNGMSRGQVFTPFGVFRSGVEAAKKLGMGRTTVLRRCNNKDSRWDDWYFEKELTRRDI